jgi:hypothetical protein
VTDAWSKAKKYFESGKIFSGTVCEENRGGVVLDCWGIHGERSFSYLDCRVICDRTLFLCTGQPGHPEWSNNIILLRYVYYNIVWSNNIIIMV